MNATPRPWRLAPIGEEYCFHDGNRVAIVKDWQDGEETGEVTVAEVWPSGDSSDIADGELIVRAVNSYDAMRDALKAIRDTAYAHGSIDGLEPMLTAQDRIKILHLCWDALALSVEGPS